MRKFKCTVTRVDEYEIEFDESVIDTGFIKEFSRYFSSMDDISEMAEDLALQQARSAPYDAFFEGYGFVKINGRFRGPKDRGNEGINVKIISEDDDCVVDVEEIKEKEESCQP